ncbi:hypothetical protein LCGC14_0245570 [marine sediment metagenome]|uniref:Uncharacterized protein n=1 Tax=marine sediment metagenome TaxID=412755 RepID=A0A0F9WR08_9ZZZZ
MRSSKKDNVVVWLIPTFDIKTEKEPTLYITGLYIDSASSRVTIIGEGGMRVERVVMTMERAQEIGLIDLSVLSPYFSSLIQG